MNKTDFIVAVAEKTGVSRRNADKAVTAMIDVIKEALEKGDKLQIPSFGTFAVVDRAAREGRNPRTGEVIQIKAAKVPTFKPSKVLKALVNGTEVTDDED